VHDDVEKFAFHERISLGHLWFVLKFSVINKQAKNIKKAREPGDHENQVKGLKPKI
jgi:hypothetical protein